MAVFGRRAAAAAVMGVIAVTAPAAAGRAFAQAKAATAQPPKQVPIKKVFPYLDAYLKIPAAERSRFALVYRLQGPGGGALPGKVRVWVNQGSQRTELPVAADGEIQRLPTLGMLTDKAATVSVEKPFTTSVGLNMGLEPTAAPAAEMSAPELAAAIDQANRGIKRAAGVVRFVVPSMAAATFGGTGSGQVVTAGRAPRGAARGGRHALLRAGLLAGRPHAGVRQGAVAGGAGARAEAEEEVGALACRRVRRRSMSPGAPTQGDAHGYPAGDHRQDA